MADSKNLENLIIEEKLKPPSNFVFPFPPYNIQHDFMTKLYTALENKQLGIFESPTGTGKTLSIICGAVLWLLDHEKRELRQLKATVAMIVKKNDEYNIDNDDDWIVGQAKVLEQQRKVHEINLMIESIEEFDNNIIQIKKEQKFKKSEAKSLEINVLNNKSCSETSKNDDNVYIDEDTEFLLEEYDQSSTVDDLKEEESADDKNSHEGIKIYFCSRTHSQLSQFISELKKSPYASVRAIPLASRQNYCINKTVKSLKNNTLINERCLEMGKSKSKQKPTTVSSTGSVVKKKKADHACKCVYNDKDKIQSLAEEITFEIKDIEQLVDRGQQLSACPYYASRESLKYSQIVVLPYNTLLHKNTREASGIRLEGNVFIIDEAHNLLDTIGNIHSCQINGQQLTYSYSQLSQYKNKFKLKLNASNLLRLDQLIYVIGKLIVMLGGTPGISHAEASRKGIDSKVYTLLDFGLIAEIGHLNMFELVKFVKKSKIAQKVRGYSEKYLPSVNLQQPKQNNLQNFLKNIEAKKNKKVVSLSKNENQEAEPVSMDVISNNPLTPVMAFIESLTNHCEDGRIVCSRQEFVSKGVLKYLLLNPATHFQEIVDKARSVIVSGGTMEPISEFKDQLFNFSGSNSDRIVHFSCGHVVPSENILPLIMCSGPTGKQLNFSYQERTTNKMLNEIGSVLENVCRIVPAGIVCFFPSYDYEQLVYQHLEKSNVISKLSERKKVFREPKSTNQIDEVLKSYSKIITESQLSNSKITGALMFSVIGGKLSEGLNFSDDLGRCVIVIGLPYPNIKSAELQEKMNYLNSHVGHGAGQKYYENLCMKAVNQSIGRSVRHKEDYASVLLLDHRYQKVDVRNALPNWLQSSLQIHNTFGSAFAQLNKFFASKKKIKC